VAAAATVRAATTTTTATSIGCECMVRIDCMGFEWSAPCSTVFLSP
jgi:hypothetical protein